MSMYKNKKKYVAPAMTIVRCEESLMENWSEHPLPGQWQIKEQSSSSNGIGTNEQVGETYDQYIYRNMWDDYSDNNEYIHKN